MLDAKVRDYLLDDSGEKQRSRQKFFTSFGFRPEAWPELQQALLTQLRGSEARISRTSETHGVTYGVYGPLATPSGRAVNITSYWIVRPDDPRPQFTSAIPGQR